MKLLVGCLLGLAAGCSGLKCQAGSVPDALHVCIRPQYIEGCYTYAAEDRCAQCNYDYQLQATGLCSYDPATAEPCCLQMGIVGCAKCNRGLALLNGVCTSAQAVGCLQHDQNGDCVNCASDFVLDKGKCRQGIKNCQIYTDSSLRICQKCSPNFSLTQNFCLRNRVLGCKLEQNFNCIQCFAPFSLSEGRCVVEHCKSYNDFGCESCDCGYFITRRNSCSKMDEGCVRYQKGLCTDCYPPFTLQGAQCVIEGCEELDGLRCRRCTEQYELRDGSCHLPNCLSSKHGNCEVCAQNYNYVNGGCQAAQQRMVFN